MEFIIYHKNKNNIKNTKGIYVDFFSGVVAVAVALAGARSATGSLMLADATTGEATTAAGAVIGAADAAAAAAAGFPLLGSSVVNAKHNTQYTRWSAPVYIPARRVSISIRSEASSRCIARSRRCSSVRKSCISLCMAS